jgi:translation initiation factor 2 alpha subunit (eIF-2alpha)
VLPDIVFPPPGEGEIVEDILEQILPEDDRSVSRSDSFQALEGLTQAVLAGNAIQQKMLEVQLKMLAAVNNNFRPNTVTIEKFIYVNCSNTDG